MEKFCSTSMRYCWIQIIYNNCTWPTLKHFFNVSSFLNLRNVLVLKLHSRYRLVFYSLLQPPSMIIMNQVRFSFQKFLYVFVRKAGILLSGLFVFFLQIESVLCSILHRKEARWSPHCVQRTCANAQKVGKYFYCSVFIRASV